MSWFVTGTSESASGSTSRTSLPCEATRIRGRLAIAHTTQGTRTLPHHRGMLGVLDGLHEINVRVLACQRQEAATHAPAGSVDRELDRHCSARGQAVSALPERFGSSHEHAVASRASRHARTTPTHTTCNVQCALLLSSSSRVFWRRTQLRPPNAALVRSALLFSIHAAVAAARDSRPRALPGGPRCSPFCAQNATCFVARVGGTGARAASRESRSLWGLVPKPWEAAVPRAEWRKRAGRWNAIRWARPRGAREHGATDGAVVEAGGRRRPPVCLS